MLTIITSRKMFSLINLSNDTWKFTLSCWKLLDLIDKRLIKKILGICVLKANYCQHEAHGTYLSNTRAIWSTVSFSARVNENFLLCAHTTWRAPPERDSVGPIFTNKRGEREKQCAAGRAREPDSGAQNFTRARRWRHFIAQPKCFDARATSVFALVQGRASRKKTPLDALAINAFGVASSFDRRAPPANSGGQFSIGMRENQCAGVSGRVSALLK